MTARSRFLCLSVDPAYPPISGADLRTWQNAKALSSSGNVLLASVGAPASIVPQGTVRISHLQGMDAALVWGGDFGAHFSPLLIENFRVLCRDFNPDAIVLESLPLGRLTTVAAQLADTVIMDMHNVESTLAAQEIPSARNADEHAAFSERAERLRRLENEVLEAAHLVWVCSADDRLQLLRHGADEAKIRIVPNAIPRYESVPVSLPSKSGCNPPALLFIGHLHYYPNIEAALALIDMMPRLSKALPGSKLTLAGRNPHSVILARARSSQIEVIENPISTDSLLSSSDLAVLPLRQGGGTRIKALEAMAWGLPIVATAKAVEGLDLRDGVHVAIAETPDEFIAAICELSTNSRKFGTQRTQARTYAMEKFGSEAISRAVHAGLS
jgi:glycosyltransferase involved in cell wall biosynthesis